jgi:hypothetical protein
MHEHVFEERGVTWAAAVATWTQVLMRAVGLGGVTALCSCDSCCICWRLCLDDSATNVVGLLLDLVMVAMRGVLIGLTIGMSVGTLGLVPAVAWSAWFFCCHWYGVWECLLVPAPSELLACCKYSLGQWFLQIGGDLFLCKPVLHRQYVVCPVQLESSWLCPSFLGWL